MKIDTNAYLGKWPFAYLPNAGCADWRKVMRKEGITRSLVSSIDAVFLEDPQEANEDLIQQIGRSPSFYFMAVINPQLDNWLDSLSICIKKHHAKAIKVYPNYHRYDMRNKRFALLLGQAEKRRIPVIIQIRLEDVRSQHPLMKVPDLRVPEVIKIARKFPKLRIILGGISRGEIGNNAKSIRRMKNVFTEMSFVDGLNCIRNAVAMIGNNKLMFATSHPFLYAKSSMMKIEEAGLSPKEKEAIYLRNAKHVFKI